MSKLQELALLTDEELYESYNEDDPETASQGVRDAYKAYTEILDTYIAEVSQHAFSCGFRYALKVMSEV